MAENAQDAVLKHERDAHSGRLAVLHLFVPEEVANIFRQVAKKLIMSPQVLLEEMVELNKRTIQITAVPKQKQHQRQQ